MIGSVGDDRCGFESFWKIALDGKGGESEGECVRRGIGRIKSL